MRVFLVAPPVRFDMTHGIIVVESVVTATSTFCETETNGVAEREVGELC